MQHSCKICLATPSSMFAGLIRTVPHVFVEIAVSDGATRLNPKSDTCSLQQYDQQDASLPARVLVHVLSVSGRQLPSLRCKCG